MLDFLVRRASLGVVVGLVALVLPASLFAQRAERALTNVKISAAGTSVDVSWTPVSDKNVAYRVLRAPNARDRGVDLTDPIRVANFTDVKVEPGVTYFYQIVALYEDGTLAAAAPVGFTVPSAAPVAPIAPVPIAAAPVVPRTRIPTAGPVPTGVFVNGTPLEAQLAWNAMPNAIRYAVYRDDGVNSSVERTPAGFTGTQLRDVLPDPRPAYRYTVVAYYADGTAGSAPPVQFISPPMINPSGFKAQQVGLNFVRLEWQAVLGAVNYRLDGPGLPSTGYHTTSTFHQYGAPAGVGSWKVVALYPGNFADYATGSTVSKVIRVLPSHSQPWLSKNNGPGRLDLVQTPSASGISYNNPSPVLPLYKPEFAAPLAKLVNDSPPDDYTVWPNDATVLDRWLGVYQQMKLWDRPTQWDREAVYGNPGDLGVGRRAACAQTAMTGPAAGLHTVCYASAHGVAPGQPGFNDPNTITNPGNGNSPSLLLTMVIKKDPSGSVFLVFKPAAKYTLSPQVTLDTEGPKFVPHACLSCHGGTYNPTTRKVDGATLLPIDPSLMSFASPAAQAAQENKIREINYAILLSNPSSAVAAYIRGLYNNQVGVPGRRATPDYVPQSWAPQAGFYRTVVKPYCAMCHLAAPSQYNFASWGNFQANGGLIHASVCGAHTMPHSELQFKEFWLKDTGPLYLPGLLAATLGFQRC